MQTFDRLESEVRGYIRHFPVLFNRAKGSFLYDDQEKEYIDFFAGAGTLNYGHNNDLVTPALIEYLQSDGILHGLDMATTAKKKFLEKIESAILEPRHMTYRVQFSGPTGSNAVETALKLVRKVKQRSNIVAFTNAFHGLTMGAMGVTGNAFYRDESFINRANVTFMPFDGYFGKDVDTSEYFRKFLDDNSSGVDLPAAVILETVQAEGGVNVASDKWLQSIEQICRDYDILLIVDDIQVGNGRTGEFFSFERAGLNPDVVVLSKSIGGGLPLSLVLIRPEIDQWKPGEHTGTFRGNNLAFIASTQLLGYWDNDNLRDAVKYKETVLRGGLEKILEKYPELNGSIRGRGLIYGLHIPFRGFCEDVSARAFEKDLVIELAGAEDNVLKFLPPLTIEEDTLERGIGIIGEAIGEVLEERNAMKKGEIIE
ncbi:MAG: diaminobutyrate--2-oxoglutarate transaminase [Thermodesulfobacteriota bacterium]|nr:diaminobutyrate--2-oxoglutarate transaminase [Thermodesulfobacteriota bacterium]